MTKCWDEKDDNDNGESTKQGSNWLVRGLMPCIRPCFSSGYCCSCAGTQTWMEPLICIMQLMMKAWLLPRKVNLSTQFLNSLKFLYDCRSFTIKTKSFVYFPHLYTRLYENGYKRVQVYRFLPSHVERLQLPTHSASSGQNVILICKTVTM